MRKRFSTMFVMGIMLLLLTSCTSGTKTEEKKLDKEHVFKETDLSEYLTQMELTEIDQIIYKNGRLYVKGSYVSYDENIYDYNRYASINVDGSDVKKFTIQTELKTDIDNASSIADDQGEDASSDIELYSDDNDQTETEERTTQSISYSTMGVNEKGNILLLKNTSIEKQVGEDYTYEYLYGIAEFDQEGNVIREVPIETDSENDTIGFTSFVFGENDKAYYSEENKIIELNREGKKAGEYELKGTSGIGNIYIKDNRILVTAWDSQLDKLKLFELNTANKSFSEGVEIPGNSSLFTGDNKYDFYLSTDKELKGWNVADESPVMICNYIDSDLSTSYMNNIVSYNSDTFIVVYMDDTKTILSQLNKVNPEDVKDKKVITIGGRYIGYQIKKRVVDYNKNNDNYRIQLVEYSDYDTADEANGGLTRLNLDIAAGKGPDIYLLDETMPIESYISKGLFEDVKPMMEKSGLNIDDYASNAMELYKKDNKLYCVVPSFYVQTYVAKQSLTDNIEKWDVKSANELINKLPEGSSLFEYKTKDDVLAEGINYAGNNYIDWDKGTCNFNSEEFIGLLELANSFPKEIDYEGIDYTGLWDNSYRDNKVVLMNVYMGEIGDINYIEKGNIGEKVNFVGFPAGDNGGSIITSNMCLAISSKCSSKDEAWEFISYYLSEDYQSSEECYGFPVLKKCLEAQIQKAIQKPYYMDENGNKVEYDQYYYIGDKEILITPMSIERANEVYDYVLSVKQRSFANNEISKIINEEVQGYFEGQKSAQEVANIIQSRVEIYVKENK